MKNKQIQGTLVYDGDWLAYLVACSVEKNSVKIYDENDCFVKEYKNKTKYKADKEVFNENYTIVPTKVLHNNYLNRATYILNNKIANDLSLTKCSNVIITLGGETNFRDRLNLPRQYKGSRKDTERPLALKEIRDLLTTKYTTIISEDEEADDLISKYQFKSAVDKDEKIIVCTLDKDARGTPGYLYEPNSNSVTYIEGLGYLERKLCSNNKDRKLYGIGRKWFYSQLLTGDKADDYFPCDIYKTIVGNTSKSPLITDLKCFNLLSNCETDYECLKVIKDTYYNWYKDVTEWTTFENKVVKGTWLDILQMYVDVVHMRRFDLDRVDIKKVLTNFGLINNDEKN